MTNKHILEREWEQFVKNMVPGDFDQDALRIVREAYLAGLIIGTGVKVIDRYKINREAGEKFGFSVETFDA